MKRIPKPVFFIVAVLILAFTVTSLVGVKYYDGDIQKTVIKGLDDIRWGIDIRGGVEATFKPNLNPSSDTKTATADQTSAATADQTATKDQIDSVTDELLDAAKSIIEVRMVGAGITDYEIFADYGNECIIVRFPWKENEKEFDPIDTVNELSAEANLEFKDPNGETILTGADVKKASSGYQQTDDHPEGEPVVLLELNSSGKQKFADATGNLVGQQIGIYMDGEMLSNPKVSQRISDGSAIITGMENAEAAATLANQINGGALPFALKAASYSSISPTLGQNSLSAMGYAAIIAFVLIAIFMIIRYRVPGLVAVIALIGQMGLSIAAIHRFFPVFNSFTMTLPGIAGLILSVGMGVDANIITAERIKEEFRAGKTLDAAIERGSKSSLSAIIDGNMTIVIVSIILLLVFGPSNILSWIFGESTTGTIYAFGYTLLMGVISNFIMGVWLSRVMLKSVAGIKPLRKQWLFGGAKK